MSSGSDTESAIISNAYTHSIKTESQFTDSRDPSILSQSSDSDGFVPNDKLKKIEDAFLGYYECLIGNSESLIPFSTARIDLHGTMILNEGKHLVLTKIKESPYLNNTSILFITGKGRKKMGEWTGKMFNGFPEWIQSVRHLLSEDPVKGLGSYEVFIKKEMNTGISEKTLKKWEAESKKKKDINYKLSLAGFYMKSNEVNDGNYNKTNKCYLKAKDLYLKAESLGSFEAKLCLGAIYSIGLTKPKDYKPAKAKKYFKKIAKKTKDENIARIAMRNVATLFHNNEIEKKKTGLLEYFSSLIISNKPIKPLHLKNAETWYQKSLGLKDSQSAYQLGLLYENNFYDSIKNEIEENKKKAEELFEKAVKGNNLYAKAKLGRILINNKKDESRGLKLLKEAAEKLDMGQTYLGEYYEKAEDYEKAVKFYSKAARQRRGYYSHAAQYRLNRLNDKELINEDTNIEDILEYYRKECKYGYVETGENFEKIR
ncbi:hypothetical protein RhiirA1_472346 [Rhizophagus irregularis]|uniref:Sel1 repeat protein n=1 Tax=Rhizophagus irregularis TaxID=588596 RepID=A0A2N0R2L0_9GLOM|nr:hypothetical protein RhiirA1_472346 [Rhizophagus irregularis]CAB4462739.1 unnamed protein product [Rhizophagus irregularis]